MIFHDDIVCYLQCYFEEFIGVLDVFYKFGFVIDVALGLSTGL